MLPKIKTQLAAAKANFGKFTFLLQFKKRKNP
jgi:hypothetical protein